MGEAKPDEKSIFNAVRRLDTPEARRLYLDQACGEAPDVRARVEALLRVHDGDSTFLESPPLEFRADVAPPTDEAPGTIIGSYTLLRQLGEGGMGVVFLAEQSQPVRRQVALKITRPGMDSWQVLARFEAERQALARMDHPNIAKVLDAGTTRTGRPYFVMELVQGVPITRYCDEQRLTVRQRLDLFVAVCQGVQHAHQKGVVHRDLKPSNVLVPLYDGKPVPKIIDFGLAKATGRKLTDSTLVTQLGLVIGTPEFMSPEQAEPSQLDIDTRSDVYSLGVLLYELLTGTTPIRRDDVRDADLLEFLRMVREDEPPRPSARLNSIPELPAVAANRGLEPRRLVGLVRGDLDWIAMKCLEKDRGRRYETADALARDVERHLRDEPVEASPPGAGYRLRKFARRHRTALATAAAFGLLLLAGVAVSTWQAVRATAAEKTALAEGEKQRTASRQARQALNTLTDETVERLMARQDRVTEQDRAFLRQVLALHQEFAGAQGDSPETRAGIAAAQYRVGLIRRKLGESLEAEGAYRAAIDLQQKLASDFPDGPEYRHDLAKSHTGLGNLLGDTGRPREAEGEYRAANDLLRKLYDDFPDVPEHRRDLAASLTNLGVCLTTTARPREAEEAYRAAVDVMRKLVADPHAPADSRSLLASGYGNLGNLLFATNRPKEAEECHRAGRDLFEKLAGEFPHQPDYRRDLARSHNNLGAVLAETGRPKAAAEAFRAAAAIQRQLAAEYPTRPEYRHYLGQSYFNLGELLSDIAPPQQVEESYREARDVFARLADDYPGVPDYQNGLASALGRLALLKEKDPTAARRLLDEARPHHQTALRAAPKNPTYRQAYHIHLATSAELCVRVGDHRKAVDAADELAHLDYEPAESAYYAARLVCQCVPLTEKDDKLTEVKRKEQAAAYADRAMALLRTAVLHGFKDGGRLTKDREFAPLRTRNDFRELLRELDAAPERR
ncbi:MAG TPA: serine/threonine-protein kinase [Fimbriiglobus sp.]|nr:serine/threonine-protein kinase [Fimbriiglobus sp.]